MASAKEKGTVNLFKESFKTVREKSKEIFQAADRVGICWPLDDDVTNEELELLLFPGKYSAVSMYVEPDYPYIQPDMYVSMGPTSGTFELWNVYYCEQKTGNYLYGGNYPLYSFGIYIDIDTLNAYSAAVGGYNEMGILFQVKDSEPIHSYTDPSKTYFLGDKLHFAYMNVPDTESNYPGILNVKILNPDGTPLQPDADAQITVVLNDIFKFKNNPLLENCFDDIKTKLIELDVNQKYDYTHIPNADDIIPDPLISKEFWNKNHVYNQFTIAQLNADDIDYKFIT